MLNHVISGVMAVVCLATVGQGQVIGFGDCPDVPTQAHLDVSKYLGLWYEIERFPAIFEGDNCGTANYSLKDNGKINVDNRYIKDGVVHNAIGEANVRDFAKDEATLDVVFSSIGPKGDYRVIETDYTSYSLVFSCTAAFHLINTEFAWILTRDPQPDPQVIARLKTVLSGHGVDVSKFQVTNQTGCPIYEKFTGVHLG